MLKLSRCMSSGVRIFSFPRNSNRIHLARSFSVIPPPTEKEKEKPKADPDKIDWKRVIPVAVSNLLTGTAIGIILPVMPVFATTLGLTATQYGSVMAVMGASRLMMNIPAAYLVDKYGRRPLLIIGPALTAISMSLTGICTSAMELIAVRFVSGAGGSLSMTASSLYLADISTAKNRARTMAPSVTAFIAGMGLGPGIGGWLVDNVGPTSCFTLVGSLIGMSVVSNYLLLPETKVFEKEIALSAEEQKKFSERHPLSVIGSEFRRQFVQWVEIMKNEDLRLMVLSHTCYWTCSSAVSFTMLPMLATGKFGMSGSLLGSCFAASAILQFVGTQPAAYLSDKFGRKTALIPSAIIVGSTAMIMPHVTTTDEFIAVMMVGAVGGAFWSTSSQSYISDKCEPAIRSQAMALHRSGGDLGIMLGAGLVGVIADYTSVATSMGTMGALLIGSIAVFARRASEVKELK